MMCIAQSKTSKVLGFTDACWEVITTDRLVHCSEPHRGRSCAATPKLSSAAGQPTITLRTSQDGQGDGGGIAEPSSERLRTPGATPPPGQSAATGPSPSLCKPDGRPRRASAPESPGCFSTGPTLRRLDRVDPSPGLLLEEPQSSSQDRCEMQTAGAR